MLHLEKSDHDRLPGLHANAVGTNDLTEIVRSGLGGFDKYLIRVFALISRFPTWVRLDGHLPVESWASSCIGLAACAYAFAANLLQMILSQR